MLGCLLARCRQVGSDSRRARTSLGLWIRKSGKRCENTQSLPRALSLDAKSLTVPTMRAVVVAYEHHLNYDMSGYPASKIRDHVSLFGNIVAIADRYDALTTARRYRRFNLTPHEVVSYLLVVRRGHSSTPCS